MLLEIVCHTGNFWNLIKKMDKMKVGILPNVKLIWDLQLALINNNQVEIMEENLFLVKLNIYGSKQFH